MSAAGPQAPVAGKMPVTAGSLEDKLIRTPLMGNPAIMDPNTLR